MTSMTSMASYVVHIRSEPVHLLGRFEMTRAPLLGVRGLGLGQLGRRTGLSVEQTRLDLRDAGIRLSPCPSFPVSK